MNVVFSRRAQSDLNEIGDYIGADNPAKADEFTRELIAACRAVADTPFAMPLLPDYGERGFRRKVFRRYVIFFTVSATRVTIVRILQGARDHRRHL